MAKLQLSKKGAMELIGHEAIVQTRYKDSVGVFTIGVGHTAKAGAPDPKTFTGSMPVKDVLDLFIKDVQKYVDAVNKAIKANVTQTEFDALVSFHYNTGAIAKAALVTSINKGDKKTAARQFLNFNKPKEVIGRRTKEQKLFAEGVYSNNGKATVYPVKPSLKPDFGKGKSVDLAKLVDGAAG